MATAPPPRRGRPKITAPRRHGPEFSADTTWTELSHNIGEILNHRAANLSFEENHRYAYNMVLYKQGNTLYQGVKSIVTDNLVKLAKENVIPLFPTKSVDSDDPSRSDEESALLKALRKVWDDHTSSMSRLAQILRYMDRVYVDDAGVPSTIELGVDLFIRHVMTPDIREHVINGVLRQVYRERVNQAVKPSAIKECVDVFLRLPIPNTASVQTHYKTYLEPRILQDSRTFYEKEAKTLLESCDASAYLAMTESRLKAEDDRVHHYLSAQTGPALQQILKDNLLTPNIPAVISKEGSGLNVMIDNNKSEDLQRLYRLCKLVESGLKSLRDHLKASVIRRGSLINENASIASVSAADGDEKEGGPSVGKAKKGPPLGLRTAINWVQEVSDLKTKFDDMWKNDFDSNREIETALIEAFETFVNKNKRAPEFVSLFIDDNLKSGFKGKPDEEVDAILDQTVNIFRYLSDKDTFEKYYKTHLSKRLVQGKSVNDDAEHGMLAKLKVECGVQFTRKMEGMFSDIKVSQDMTRQYQTYVSNLETPPPIPLSVIVMTSNCWPSSKREGKCQLPTIMSMACQSFEKFYLGRHSGRQLTWQLGLGSADVKTRFKAKVHELNVATYALVILLLFQDLADDEFLTYQEIKDATMIEDSELRRHLQSLACAKYKILRKHPPGREIDSEDSFSFNSDFTTNAHKIKISTISMKVETEEENRETQAKIEEERLHHIDLCIVRIMKSRKTATHVNLMNEVTRQLSEKFIPDPQAIKKRIESLIEREYLDRAEDDRKSYIYKA